MCTPPPVALLTPDGGDTGQTDALTSNLYSTLPFDGVLCGSNALQIISRAVMCDQPVMSAAAETKKETAILRLVACHWG